MQRNAEVGLFTKPSIMFLQIYCHSDFQKYVQFGSRLSSEPQTLNNVIETECHCENGYRMKKNNCQESL